MKVAVVGATGKTRQALAAWLLAAAHQVRAVVRNPARADGLARKGA